MSSATIFFFKFRYYRIVSYRISSKWHCLRCGEGGSAGFFYSLINLITKDIDTTNAAATRYFFFVFIQSEWNDHQCHYTFLKAYIRKSVLIIDRQSNELSSSTNFFRFKLKHFYWSSYFFFQGQLLKCISSHPVGT